MMKETKRVNLVEKNWSSLLLRMLCYAKKRRHKGVNKWYEQQQQMV